MKKLTASDTLSLSLAERIQLVEEIWDTMATQSDAVELTGEEKRLIDERLEAHRRNPGESSPWEEVHRRILSRRE